MVNHQAVEQRLSQEFGFLGHEMEEAIPPSAAVPEIKGNAAFEGHPFENFPACNEFQVMRTFPGDHEVSGPDLRRFYGFPAERVVETEHQPEHSAFDPVTDPGIKILEGQFIDIEVHVLMLHAQLVEAVQPYGKVSVNGRRTRI